MIGPLAKADVHSAELEMTVNMLIQIDKLVQLLESPVFTCTFIMEGWVAIANMQPDLRLQLLEPERYPHLYKCLYGLLMLLPQSSAFAALKNRLNSVSAIGYLHIAPRTYVSHVRQKSTEAKFGSTPQTPGATFDRPNRLKPREEPGIKWTELLEKFKSVQEKARRAHRLENQVEDGISTSTGTAVDIKDKMLPEVPKQALRPSSEGSASLRPGPPSAALHKPKSSLGNLGRFAGGVAGRKGKK